MGGIKDLFGDEPVTFNQPMARPSDPETSHMAAERMLKFCRADRLLALQAHGKHPHGLTDHELAALCDRQHNSIGKRRTDLRDAGLVEDSTLRRSAPSGSTVIVWRITELGKRFLIAANFK